MTTIKSSRTLDRYKQNLSVVETNEGTFVKSYETLVAKIDYGTRELIVLGYWSMTTSKHINYVASKFNLTIKK